MTASVSGLGSGLDINGIVDQLMQIETQGQTRVIARRDAAQARLTALGKVRSQIASVSSAASALDQTSAWKAFNTSSSDTDKVTATASSSATTGSLTFTVDRLASSAAMRSTNTIPSTGTVIANGNLLVAKGGSALGFATLASDASLPTEKFEIRVTQSSAAATRNGASAIAASTVIAADNNDTITANVNGSAQNFTIAAGTYTRAQLAAAVQAASGGLLTASVGATTNRLTLQTVTEGSAASIEVTGGSALSDLGLTVDASAATGTDGVVKVGDTSTTVTSIAPGGTVSLGAETGSVNATFSGGLRVGMVTARNVSVGTGTLSSVVNAINQTNVGVSAAAVKVGTNAYRLQITSTDAGSAGRLNLDTSAFTGIGGITTISTGTNAKITIGDGDGAYSVESSSNNVTGVLPGVTIALKTISTDPVTVSVARDPNTLADKVNTVVKAVNDAITLIKSQSAYNAATKTSGPLGGTAAMRSIMSSLTQAISKTVTGNTLGAANQLGISVNRDGGVDFNRAKFLTAYNNDPEAVSDVFVRRGTTTNAAVAFNGASTRTKPGTYAVNITAVATRAAASGNVLSGGAITDAETIDIKLGNTTATYAAGAGESLADMATGLNAALAASGLALSASVSGNRLTVQANAYGTNGSFSIRSSATGAGQSGLVSSASAWESHPGVNVAGTIGGKAATGSGSVLNVATSDADIPGLSIAVTGTTTGDLGTITYAPGIAARLGLSALAATDAATGSITSAETGGKSTATRYDKDIADWDRRLVERRARLKAQYATLDSTLGQLRNQSSWVSSQLSSLG